MPKAIVNEAATSTAWRRASELSLLDQIVEQGRFGAGSQRAGARPAIW